jgi:hypothetical protein
MDFMMDGSFDIKKMRDFSSDMSIMTEGLQGVVANIDWVDRTKLSSYLKEAEPLDAYFRSLDRAITNSDKRSPLVMAIARYLSILKCSRDTLSLTNLLTDMAWRVAIAAMRVNTQRAMSIGILKEDETIKQIQTLDL